MTHSCQHQRRRKFASDQPSYSQRTGNNCQLINCRHARRTHFIQRRRIPLVRRESCQCNQLVTVFRVFDGTELEYVPVDLLSLFEFFWVILSELGERLDDTLQDCLLNLTEE